jgi:Protein of unknown function (DUF1822)
MNDLLAVDDDDFYSFDEEEILLTEKQIAEAVKISEPVTDRELQWQVYLSSLALSGFTSWLDDRDDELKIDTSKCPLFTGVPKIGAASRLQIGGFKVCVIAKGGLDGDYVNVPQAILKDSAETAQFYVFVEVLEEISQAVMYGFLRSDRLDRYAQAEPLEDFSDGTCDLPVSWLNLEFDELVSYLRCFNPSAIPLPATKKLSTIIGQWFQGAIEAGWQTVEQIESLVNTPTFAFRSPVLQYATRSRQPNSIERGKVIDLSVGSEKISVALVIDVTPIENGDEVDIWARLYPIGRDTLLPNIKLSILEDTGEVSLEAISRNMDNSIQQNFTASASDMFVIKIEFESLEIIEHCIV